MTQKLCAIVQQAEKEKSEILGDENQLLQDEDLGIAEEWSRDKNLSDLDYRFLAASQKRDRQYRERRIVEILAVLHYRNGDLKSYLQEIAVAVSELLNDR